MYYQGYYGPVSAQYFKNFKTSGDAVIAGIEAENLARKKRANKQLSQKIDDLRQIVADAELMASSDPILIHPETEANIEFDQIQYFAEKVADRFNEMKADIENTDWKFVDADLFKLNASEFKVLIAHYLNVEEKFVERTGGNVQAKIEGSRKRYAQLVKETEYYGADLKPVSEETKIFWQDIQARANAEINSFKRMESGIDWKVLGNDFEDLIKANEFAEMTHQINQSQKRFNSTEFKLRRAVVKVIDKAGEVKNTIVKNKKKALALTAVSAVALGGVLSFISQKTNSRTDTQFYKTSIVQKTKSTKTGVPDKSVQVRISDEAINQQVMVRMNEVTNSWRNPTAKRSKYLTGQVLKTIISYSTSGGASEKDQKNNPLNNGAVIKILRENARKGSLTP